MRAVGIICEYNPYHRGHAYQLTNARRVSGADVVVAVMSEHATQRGELAVADGYIRAEAAVRAGADVVVGLPFPYCSASAEFFALAGVRILDALGVQHINFGSESAQLDALKDAASRLYSPTFIAALTEYQQANPTRGVMECRAAVYERLYGCALPGDSNDLLGVAYLHAMQSENSPMVASLTPRIGQDYTDDGTPVVGTYPPASACRALWASDGLDALGEHLPAPVLNTLRRAENDGLAPARADVFGNALLSFYRLADAAVLAQYAGMGGGLAEHLCRAAKGARDFASFWQGALTRRYTDGRLRRAMLYGICGVTDGHLSAPPAYVRLLGANARGCEFLAAIRKRCTLPLLTKPADLPTDAPARRQRAVEERLEALYSLALPAPQEALWLLRRGPYIDKS